jgi:flagellar biogenesis protein FliO
MVEQILAAAFVIGLLLATVWLLRRKGLASATPLWRRAAQSNSMQVVERLQLTSQHSLHLVRLGDELILIGVSPASCGRIALKPAVPEVQMRAAL